MHAEQRRMYQQRGSALTRIGVLEQAAARSHGACPLSPQPDRVHAQGSDVHAGIPASILTQLGTESAWALAPARSNLHTGGPHVFRNGVRSRDVKRLPRELAVKATNKTASSTGTKVPARSGTSCKAGNPYGRSRRGPSWHTRRDTWQRQTPTCSTCFRDLRILTSLYSSRVPLPDPQTRPFAVHVKTRVQIMCLLTS